MSHKSMMASTLYQVESASKGLFRQGHVGGEIRRTIEVLDLHIRPESPIVPCMARWEIQ